VKIIVDYNPKFPASEAYSLGSSSHIYCRGSPLSLCNYIDSNPPVFEEAFDFPEVKFAP